jgi:hypothetical protein
VSNEAKRKIVMYAAEIGNLMVAEVTQDGETKTYVGADEEWCLRAGDGAYTYVQDTYIVGLLRRLHVEHKFRTLDMVVKKTLAQKNKVAEEG